MKPIEEKKKFFVLAIGSILMLLLVGHAATTSAGIPGTAKWAYRTGTATGTAALVYSSPAIGADGTIYARLNDSNLYEINPGSILAINPDGTLKWRYASENVVESTPAIGPDGTIYVESGDGTISVKPPNKPPVAVCQNVTVAADTRCTANASINNGSYDPDGDPITLTQSPAGPYQLGNTSVTLTATDSKGTSTQCAGTVTVVDKTPPTITFASINPSELWPPNHKMVDVTVNCTSTDNCSQSACGVSSVTSNEPISSSDYTSVDAHHVKLSADRSGSGNGRIYTITITCTDASGNSSSQAVMVTVPHDQGKE